MNNDQFRRLIQGDAATAKSTGATDLQVPQDGRATATLGSRARSSIPMTPRSISSSTASTNFARQLAEYKTRNGEGPPPKRFKSSVAPKGTKLASGFVDRTALRRADEDPQPSSNSSADEEDKKKRLKALEEMMKLGQMDKETFLKLRKELGFQGEYDDGQKSKGLDFALLERTRRGEPAVEEETTNSADPEKPELADEALEAALDAKVEETVGPVEKEAHVKKGTLAPLSSSEARKLSRDQILQRLKASRSSVTTGAEHDTTGAEEPTLGTKFKKIGPEKKRWIETDENGRRKEILMTTGKDGQPKRKVRWLDKEPIVTKKEGRDAQVAVPKPSTLGMEVPAEVLARQKALQEQVDEDDGDIFAGVGSNYDPLGGDGAEENSDDSDAERQNGMDKQTTKSEEPEFKITSSLPSARRDYFATSAKADTTDESPQSAGNPLASDPTILAALKRAAALRQSQEGQAASSGQTDPKDVAGTDRHQQMLEKLRKRERDDAGDIDLGFGESRFADEEDDEDVEVWGEEGEKKSAGRKRGPKKRKGNKDSVNDIMGVLESRKKEK